ncbi:FAD-dependent monooxygenase [Muricoccus nepalensis]|uniref:FAD-dependent monooxygenase n=1 Tax=Muricoccus nepalensis TaxID=1854500 RepID=UPI00138763F6|nr:FAD-dependent monooxygenase [Roseomonas nepalensis]
MSGTVVIGGGPAGAAAAILLARAGARVTVVEREAAAREKVCGEFLGPDAAALMASLGLPLPSLGAVPVSRGALAAGSRDAAWALPFAAWSLPRAVMDEALLDAAARAGATVLRGRGAAGAAREGEGWSVRLAGGARLAARSVVLATGKHELRGHARSATRGQIGLKLPLRLAGPMEGTVLLLPFAGGYAGLQPRGGEGAGREANLCAALRAVGSEARDPAALLGRVASGSALAARLLRDAEPLLARPLAVGGVPYGFRHRDGAGAPCGLYRAGDQFAVVPSLAGDGVAMALAGGMAAARAILEGVPSAAFHRALDAELGRPMRWAGAIARLLEAAPGALTLAAGVFPAGARLAAARTRLPSRPRPVAGGREGGAGPVRILARR